VNAHTRIALKLVHGESFAENLARFIRPLLIKGAPSVMTDLKELYFDPAKVACIEAQLLKWHASMDEFNTLGGAEDEEEQDPTVILWLKIFVAQHYLFVRDLDKALVYINQGIEHTPTHIDLYLIKAQILQKGGDWKRGQELYEEGRMLDQADRALNALSAK
jgi:hypothetical protein